MTDFGSTSPTEELPPQPAPGPHWYQFQAQLPPQTYFPLDRVSYFDTPSHVYLVATNRQMRQYRMVKFSKDDEKLDVHVFHSVYDRAYVSNLVQTLKAVSTDVSCGKARGILGFVRFTKGYYVILIKRRCEVARIGMHRIFEIKDTLMLSLNERQSQTIFRRRTDEDDYRERFMNFELKNYFYYSHTYDLTNTLQTNMVTGWKPPAAPSSSSAASAFPFTSSASWRKDKGGAEPQHRQPQSSTGVISPNKGEGDLNTTTTQSATTSATDPSRVYHPLDEDAHSSLGGGSRYATQHASTPPSICFASVPIRSKFVWNEFLLGPVSVSGPRLRTDLTGSASTRGSAAAASAGGPSTASSASSEFTCSMMHKDGGLFVSDAWLPWVVFAIRGCVAQCTIEATGGNPVNMLLIGRTSKHFAGARYLRRGVNEDGHVANHVEVEQIVYLPASLNDLSTRGRFSSYVQVRGSVPVSWFHGMVNRPKPPILLGRNDPFFNHTRLHMTEIFQDFGAPVVLMNLLKLNEKKKREAVLTNEYLRAFHVLSQEMEREYALNASPLRYHSFDLRNAAERAWNSMTAIAERDGDDIGVFACDDTSVRLQCGVVRSNCVDCIDRTNLAQFFFGFHALGKQLTALGVLYHEVDLAQSHEAVYDVLLRLYLRLGDAIAIQYGGSAQVGAGFLHRGIGWDKFMGIRRLYNNLMTDKDKQLVTNLFLGLYEPCPNPLRLGDQKLTLPLHRTAAVMVETIEAARRRAAAAAREEQRSEGGGGLLGSRVFGIDDGSWENQSPLMDDAAKLATRRVVDITDVEGDYYLHCSCGPAVMSGEALKGWWKGPLEQYNARYSHVTCGHRDAIRASRYSSVRKSQPDRHPLLPSAGLATRLSSVEVVGIHGGDAPSRSSSHPVAPPSVLSREGLTSASRAASPPLLIPPIPVTLPGTPLPCPPYVILTSTGVMEVLHDASLWRHYGMEVWLEDRRGATGIQFGDSDGEVEPSLIADMYPLPTLKSTSSSTSASSATALLSSSQNFRLVQRCLAFTTALYQHESTVEGDDEEAEDVESTSGWCPLWQRNVRIKKNSASDAVIRDPEPDVYFSRGPDYGRSCEMVHNLQTYPDEVHNSIYMTELREYRRRCDEPPRRRDVDGIKINCLLRFGPPAEWDEATLIEALDTIEDHGISSSLAKFIRLQRLTGHLLLHPSMSAHIINHAQHEHRHTLLNVVELIKRIPVTPEGALERYAGTVPEGWECTPEWIRDLVAPHSEELFPVDGVSSNAISCGSACSHGALPPDQHANNGGSSDPSSVVAGALDSTGWNMGTSAFAAASIVMPVGVGFAETTTRFLQKFVRDQLYPHSTERFIRCLLGAMAAPPQDPNNRRMLHGGIPRFDRLRHHDLGHRGGPFDVVVLHHTFWGITAIRWLMANSTRLGMTLHHTESGEEYATHRAAELLAWLLDAGMITVADTHDRAAVGVDVWSPPLKDASCGFLERCAARLFTMPVFHPYIVLNMSPEDPQHASAQLIKSSANSLRQVSGTAANSTGSSSSMSAPIGGGSHRTIGSVNNNTTTMVTQSFTHEPPIISPTTHVQAAAKFLSVANHPQFAVEVVRGFTVPSQAQFTLELHSAAGTTVVDRTAGAVFGLQLTERLADMGFQALSMLADPAASSFSVAEAAFDLARQLAYIDICVMTSDERLCFFINAYNALYMHAWITALQSPAIEFRRFMCTYAYDLGGYLFTLHDIKHGILRRNRPGPYDVLAPFDLLSNDPRIPLMPAYSDRITSVPSVMAAAGDATNFRVDPRLRILLALMDMYLTPEHLADLAPYHPRVHREESVTNASMMRPIVYEDGFEIVEKDDSSEEDDDATNAQQQQGSSGGGAALGPVGGSTPLSAGAVTQTAAQYASTAAGNKSGSAAPAPAAAATSGGAAFFANLFRGTKSRVLPNKVIHPCLAVTPSMMPQQLAAIETAFLSTLSDPQQPQTSVNSGQSYPKILQALIGLEEVGATAEDAMRCFGRGGIERGGAGSPQSTLLPSASRKKRGLAAVASSPVQPNKH